MSNNYEFITNKEKYKENFEFRWDYGYQITAMANRFDCHLVVIIFDDIAVFAELCSLTTTLGITLTFRELAR